MSTKKQTNLNFSKLRRGMVFWYDPNPGVDKNNVPKKYVKEREIKDYTIYGERPYVVVSSDEACRLARVVQVCPITTKDEAKDTFPFDIVYNSFSSTGQSVIRCDQIRTVNSAELYNYDCMLDDDIMEHVADKLRELMGINDQEVEVEQPVIAMSAEEIEDLIDSKLIATKEETTSLIDAAVTRILNGISVLFNSKSLSKQADENVSPVRLKKRIVVVDTKKPKE